MRLHLALPSFYLDKTIIAENINHFLDKLGIPPRLIQEINQFRG